MGDALQKFRDPSQINVTNCDIEDANGCYMIQDERTCPKEHHNCDTCNSCYMAGRRWYKNGHGYSIRFASNGRQWWLCNDVHTIIYFSDSARHVPPANDWQVMAWYHAPQLTETPPTLTFRCCCRNEKDP